MKYAHFLAKDTSSIASGRQMETMWTTIENLKIIRTATLAGGLCSEPVVLHSPLSSGASWGPVLRRAGPQAEESGHDSLKNAREEREFTTFKKRSVRDYQPKHGSYIKSYFFFKK